ncbi:hypothetical protein AB0I28_32460 [Phytomonospora sp. NPDC050363]|uniref:PP2C family protein-serine/threonine phosphatase n=1 Tax=Phytomonospora sp. NPDC050363 TaxID=3155642 RepID=UPI0033F3BCDB
MSLQTRYPTFDPAWKKHSTGGWYTIPCPVCGTPDAVTWNARSLPGPAGRVPVCRECLPAQRDTWSERVAVAVDQGPRMWNADAAAWHANPGAKVAPVAFALADGVGDDPEPQWIAQLAVLRVAVAACHEGSVAAIEDARRARDEYYETVGAPLSQRGDTVLAVVTPLERGYQAAWCGDVRVWAYTDGDLNQYTIDHTAETELLEAGESPEMAAQYRNRVHRCLSIGDVESVFLGPDSDLILLTSDGVHDALTWAQMRQCMAEELSKGTGAAALRGAVQSLVRAARAAGGRDNATAMLIRTS